MTDPYYTLESLEPATSLGFLIKRSGLLMTQIADRRFESEPISLVQWTVLMLLTQRPHLSPTAISERLGHDMGALTRVVDDLERQGLIRRERGEHDRRAVEIAITAEGRRAAHAAKRIVVDLLNQLVEPFSKAEVDALISSMQKLLLHMQRIAKLSVVPELPSAAATHPMRTASSGARTPRRRTAGRPIK